MKTPVLFAIALCVASPAALAAKAATKTSFGSGALALAALIAEHSPLLPARDKRVMVDFLAGKSKIRYPKGRKIIVSADAVTCRASDVAIAVHSCALSFGKRRVRLDGRKAHELYATLIENGVRGDGAAGTIYEAITNLSCTIDPNEVASNDGGGAVCRFSPGS